MQLPGMGKVQHPVRWVVGILAVGTFTVGTSVYVLSRNKQEYNWEALTVPVKQTNLQVTIEASGTVRPVQSVNISPKTAGRLEALYVEQGDRVEKGQAIAVMENDQFQAQLDRAQSNLAEAQARLAEAKAGSRIEEIEQARAGLEQAKARLAEAKARIPENIAQIQFQVESAQSRFDLAQDRLDRNRRLLTEGAIAQDRFDEVENEYRSAQATLAEARKRLQQAQKTDRPEVQRLEAEVAQARANLQQLERGTRKEEIDRLEAAVNAAKAQFREAQIQFEDTTVKAPFAGIITQKYATEGAFVTPTTSASSTAAATSTSIIALAEGLEILARVPEVDVTQLKKGQAVAVRPDAFPKEVFRGRVKLIAPEAVVEQNVTSFEVRIELQSGLEQLRSGMNVDVTFLGEELTETLVIPTVAVVTREGETGVIVVNEEEEAEFQPVTLGLTIENQTQVLEGLDERDRVFIDLPEELRRQTQLENS
ncbi:efflux transporter, RND family, MFP subunit [Halothece sp. PCC 7418]|uniref:efflux RND transporter periplasmic adaptor subunit n=1 Tax=Halothece sp. (strain PCC 7418) TaxID=65093 RepID=UPI0002A065D7|nr:efflux RND transporter periplasmic adaptor subunit [Halothece sp. PCC 7418]AFZ43865.1 efflux transporter, RND family, MFP subunit [Halothece sp. PCC 7418]